MMSAGATNPSLFAVEGDLYVRETTADLPSPTGAAVRTATSGQEALRLLENHPASLAATDLSMPGGNGNRLIAQMRSPPHLRQMAVSNMSVHPESEGSDAGLQAGADYSVVGSFDLARFLEAGEKYLHFRLATLPPGKRVSEGTASPQRCTRFPG